jgi:DNA-binding Lrp family transcriptional regulator
MQETELLDEFDMKLLAALQDDGRLGVLELAERVGLSGSQCSRRRARLEQAGLITGYHAALDPRRLGLGVFAYIHVTLARHSPGNARAFGDLIARIDAVQEACAVTGDADYLLKVVVSDLPALARLINDDLLGNETVSQIRSSIVLEQLKQTGRLPLPRRRG